MNRGIIIVLCVTASLLLVQVETRARPDDFGDDMDWSTESDEEETHGHHHIGQAAPVEQVTTTTTTIAPPKVDSSNGIETEADAEPTAPKLNSEVAGKSNKEMMTANDGGSGVFQSSGTGFSGGNYAGYDESCGNNEYSRHCDAGRDMVCSPQTSRCQCDPGVNSIYVHALQRCLKIAVSMTDYSCVAHEQCNTGPMGMYSECNMETNRCQCLRMFGSTEVVRKDDKCYLRKRIGDYCQDHESCDASIKGKSICIYKPPDNGPPAPHVIPGDATKMCLCDNDYVFDNSSNGDLTECLPKGVDETSLCRADVQCTSSLGPLSRCHQSSCQCYDVLSYKSETVFYHGKCYIKLDLLNPCSEDIQCQAGIHPNAVCERHDSYLPHEKVCQCPEGKSCTGKGGAATVVSSLNLFILTVVAIKVML